MDTSPTGGSAPATRRKLDTPGDVLEGVLARDAEAFESAYGGHLVPVLAIDTGSSIEEFIASAKVIRDAVFEARPQKGDRLKIEYLGTRQARNGRQFKAFRLWVNGDEAGGGGGGARRPMDWDAVQRDGGAAEPELPVDPPAFGAAGADDDVPF